MKKISSILLCLLFVPLTNILCAQSKTIQWQKSFGGSESDNANSIQQTSDGGFIIAGYTASNDGDVSGIHGSTDFWIVKTDLNHNIVWQKALGGSADDNAQSVQQTADGGYIVAGYTLSNNGDVSGNHGSYDCWVVKLTATGNIAWQKTLGSTTDEFAYSIQQTVDSGYILTGHVNINSGDYLVMKLDPSGNLTWQKTLGGTASEEARSVLQTTDGGYVIAGFTYSNDGDVSGNHGGADYWVVKLTSTGNITWQKTFGGTGDEIANSIQQTSDGGYIIAGSSTSSRGQVSGNRGGQDYWIVKLDGAGNLVWQESMGGTQTDQAQSIQQTAEGGYIVAGYSGSNDGDVSGNHGSQDYWIVKLQSEISCSGNGSGGNSSTQKVNVCHNGNTIAVHPCAVQAHLEHGDYLGQCVQYASYRGNIVIEDKPKIDFIIYPNTSKGNFTAQLNYHINQTKDGIIQIINTSGQIIKQLKINEQDKINFSLAQSGIYFIRLTTNNLTVTKKVTVIQ